MSDVVTTTIRLNLYAGSTVEDLAEFLCMIKALDIYPGAHPLDFDSDGGYIEVTA